MDRRTGGWLTPWALCKLKSTHKQYTPAWPLKSASNLSLVAPHFKTKSYGARTFCAAPTEFNKLPQEIALVPTLDV